VTGSSNQHYQHYLRRFPHSSTAVGSDENQSLTDVTFAVGAIQGHSIGPSIRPSWTNHSQRHSPDRSTSATSIGESTGTTDEFLEDPTARVRSYAPQSLAEQTPVSPPVVLASWDGVITEVTEETFSARVTQLATEGPEEFAEFPLSDISPGDASLVRPGGLFYWTVGYETTKRGRIRRISEIRLRRLPPKSEEDRNRAKAWALEALQLFEDSGS
jgi:hypothetical protein